MFPPESTVDFLCNTPNLLQSRPVRKVDIEFGGEEDQEELLKEAGKVAVHFTDKIYSNNVRLRSFSWFSGGDLKQAPFPRLLFFLVISPFLRFIPILIRLIRVDLSLPTPKLCFL